MQQTENVGLRVRRACGLLLLNRVGVGGDRGRAEPGQTRGGGVGGVTTGLPQVPVVLY